MKPSGPPRILVVLVALVFVAAAFSGLFYLKSRNDQIREDLGMQPGESYRDVLDNLGKK